MTRPDIVTSFEYSPNQGTWSLVGTDCLKAARRTATMNLGCIDNSDEMAAVEKAVRLHQAGFTLLGILFHLLIILVRPCIGHASRTSTPSQR